MLSGGGLLQAYKGLNHSGIVIVDVLMRHTKQRDLMLTSVPAFSLFNSNKAIF